MAFSVCPECGSRNIRISKSRRFSERIRSVIGVFPFRCRQCDARFLAGIWSLPAFPYARCPKCLRLELSTWSEKHYHPPIGTTIKLRLGATPYRCDACRCNFASFRARKERYVSRRAKQSPAAEVDKTG